jgi:hypothetical protein
MAYQPTKMKSQIKRKTVFEEMKEQLKPYFDKERAKLIKEYGERRVELKEEYTSIVNQWTFDAIKNGIRSDTPKLSKKLQRFITEEMMIAVSGGNSILIELQNEKQTE